MLLLCPGLGKLNLIKTVKSGIMGVTTPKIKGIFLMQRILYNGLLNTKLLLCFFGII